MWPQRPGKLPQGNLDGRRFAVDQRVSREHPTEAAGGHFETVNRADFERCIRRGGPRVLDEDGDLVYAPNVAATSGEMSCPVPGPAGDGVTCLWWRTFCVAVSRAIAAARGCRAPSPGDFGYVA